MQLPHFAIACVPKFEKNNLSKTLEVPWFASARGLKQFSDFKDFFSVWNMCMNKKRHVHLFSLPELSLITLHWFLTAFASVVDIRILLRIWDLLFYEGSMVLFQVTLGMLKIKVIQGFDCCVSWTVCFVSKQALIICSN